LADPLAKYRKEQPKPQVNNDKKPYEAYDKRGRPCPYTEILCASQPSQAPQSRFFLTSIFGAGYDDAFTLIYSFMAVEIRGQRLKEVRQAIQNGVCGFIQEYDAEEFLPPAKGEPVIESVKFIAGEKLNDILAAHKEGNHAG
jgi:hypothetical protein